MATRIGSDLEDGAYNLLSQLLIALETHGDRSKVRKIRGGLHSDVSTDSLIGSQGPDIIRW